MEILSVNEAIDRVEALDGANIYLEGVLSYEFENVSIDHCVNSERRANGYGSSIWLEVNHVLKFDSRVMDKWSGKKVLVEGMLEKPDAEFGAGHMGLWHATIIATDIELSKKRKI